MHIIFVAKEEKLFLECVLQAISTRHSQNVPFARNIHTTNEYCAYTRKKRERKICQI